MPKVTSPFAQRLDSLEQRDARIRVDGVDTAYWEYGPEEAETTVVLVHGFRGDHHGLEPIVAFMPERVKCIIPDLPGFGESGDFPLEASIGAYASWLTAFVSQVGRSNNTVVVGHSFGSIVVSAAIAGGLTPPKLVLINPIAANALTGPRAFMTKLAIFYYQLAERLPERMGFALLRNRAIVRVMSVTMAKTKQASLRAFIHDQHDRYFSHFGTRKAVMQAFETSVSHDVSQFATSLTLPTLLLVADKDDITDLPTQQAFAQTLPDARLEVIDNVGHLIHYEAPEWAAERIAAFIREN